MTAFQWSSFDADEQGWVTDEARTAGLLQFAVTHGGSSPAVLSATLGAAWAGAMAPDIGTRCRVTIDAISAAVLGLTADQAARFSGRVADFSTEAGVHTVTGTGDLARISTWPVDGRTWPAEDDDDRARRIAADASFPIDAPGTLDSGIRLLPPLEPSTVGDSLERLTRSTAGRLVEHGSGRLQWQPQNYRRGRPSVITLDAGKVFRNGFRWTKNVREVANDITVLWGRQPEARGDTRPSVRVTDQASIDLHGRTSMQVDTDLSTGSAAYDLGVVLLARRSVPVWVIPDVTVDLRRTITSSADRALVAALAPGDRITLTGLPPGGPVTALDVFVERITETVAVSSGRTPLADSPARRIWRRTFAVTPVWSAGIGLRWSDVLPTTTWDNAAPVSWLTAVNITDPADLEA